MPAAKCQSCGYVCLYKNKRGTRLKEMKCPICGCLRGSLRRASYDANAAELALIHGLKDKQYLKAAYK